VGSRASPAEQQQQAFCRIHPHRVSCQTFHTTIVSKASLVAAFCMPFFFSDRSSVAPMRLFAWPVAGASRFFNKAASSSI